MKRFILIVASFMYLVACQSTQNTALKSENPSNNHNINKIECKDGTGNRVMTIERSINELPFPSYHVTLKFQGRAVESFSDLPEVSNNPTKFMVQKIVDIGHRQNIEVSAGINFYNGQGTGFYQEAANGGMSPLPGASYNTCTIVDQGSVGGLRPDQNTQPCSYGPVMIDHGDRVASSDGCNQCSCSNGSLACTELACPGVSFDGCTAGAIGVPEGGRIDSSDGCNTCSCSRGDFICTELACPGSDQMTRPCSYGPVMIDHGDRVASSDGCNQCSCSNGSLACTELACPGVDFDGCTAGAIGVPEGGRIDSSDGCNTCSCSRGNFICTELACP